MPEKRVLLGFSGGMDSFAAAVLLKDGRIVTGCNVENAAYGSTICAERNAIFHAVSLGCKPGDIEAIAIASTGENFSPCGACRQVIREFGADINVIFKWNGEMVMQTIDALLPYGFAPGEGEVKG